MQIAHCIHGLGLGGAQKVVATLVRGGGAPAPARGTHFVYSSSGGVLRSELEDAGARVSIVERHIPKIDPTWAMALRSAMTRDAIDLVHCHLFGDTLHGYLAARPLAIPVIATVHSEFERLPTFQRWGYRRILPRLDAIVACGEGAQRSLVSALPGLDPVLIRNGIDPIETDQGASEAAVRALRHDLGIPSEAPLVASIGRLTPQKAPAILLQAFARAQQQQAHLIFIGDGPLRGELESTPLDRETRQRVHFAGFRDGITDLLPGLDVVAFASNHEGLSIALLEAMATARALVVTDASGILEAVSNEKEALVVPKRDVAALADALDRLIGDESKRLQLGAAAQERFRSDYSSQRMVASYQKVYLRLTGGPGGGPGGKPGAAGTRVPEKGQSKPASRHE